MASQSTTKYVARKTFLTEDDHTVRKGMHVWLIQADTRGPDLYQIRLGYEGELEGRKFFLLRSDRVRCLGLPLSVGQA